MGRKRRAWLVGGTGAYHRDGRRLPGYYVRWNEPRGETTVKRSRHFDHAADARRYVSRYNATIDLHGTGQIIPISLSEACTEFLTALAARSPSTRMQYQISIQAFIRSAGDTEVADIGRPQLDRFVAEALKRSAEATVAKHVRGLRRFFRWCVIAGYAGADPTPLITTKPRQIITHRRPYVTEAQFAALLTAIDTDDRRLAVLLAATTGLDRNVIAALRPADFDLERRQIRTVRQKTHASVAPFLHDALLAAVRRKIAGASPEQGLFAGLSRQAAHRDWWKQATAAAGVPTLRFRDLRSFAANWLRQALGDFGAQKVLGHSTPAITSRHYHALDPTAQRQISRLPLPGSRARPPRAKRQTA